VFGGKPYAPVSPDVCRARGWTLGLVCIATGEVVLTRFRCRSWRCPDCAPGVNARDAKRIGLTLDALPLPDVVFLVLTFDRTRLTQRMMRKHPELSWDDAAEAARRSAWRSSRRCWKRLRDRLAWHYGATFKVDNKKPLDAPDRRRKKWLTRKRRAPLPYVQTWEQHEKPWPHVNVVVHSRELAKDMRARGSYEHVDADGTLQTFWRWANQVLQRMAVRSGFGRNVHAAPPKRDGATLAGYLVKLAAELTGSHVKNQTPIAAPRGFRRLRATPRFIPPARVSSGEFVGLVLAAPLDLIESALARGAASFEQAAGWARAAVEKGPTSSLARYLRCADPPPLLRPS
jgi:hypothetical protein